MFLQKTMRILQVGYGQMRRFGNLHANSEYKLYHGLIRLNHYVIHYSDRDMASFLAPFRLRDLGKSVSNRKLIETADNFQPDMILLWHCDIIKNETLDEIRKLVPDVRIAHQNIDPLFVPRNVNAIHYRTQSCDSIFITTAGKKLDRFRGNRANIYHIPNPCCTSIDCNDNSQKDELPIDLFFCGNSEELSNRAETVNHVEKALKNDSIDFHAYGYGERPNAWGYAYDTIIASAKMGLNLNRQEGDYLYSSDRIAQLMGNGILAFIDRSSCLDELFGESRAIYYKDKEDLVSKIREYQQDDAARRSIAAEGRRFYHEHFSSEKVADYIVSKTMNTKPRFDFVWPSS